MANDMQSMLNRLFERSGGITLHSIANPQWPLRSERLGGTYDDPDVNEELKTVSQVINISGEVGALTVHGGASRYTCKDGEKVYEATLKALEAHGHNNPRKAIECAREALAVSSFCGSIL